MEHRNGLGFLACRSRVPLDDPLDSTPDTFWEKYFVEPPPNSIQNDVDTPVALKANRL